MQTRWKEMAFTLPLLAIGLLVYSERFPLYPSDQLDRYPTTQGVVSELRVENFNGRRGSDYFEYAIYLEKGRRFFLRQPSENEFHQSIYAVRRGMPIVVSHLSDEEDGRGHRIVNITSESLTLYSLDTALDEMRSKQIFMRYFALALVILSAVSFVVWRRRTANPS